jgi:iron(III) transport system permease protein
LIALFVALPLINLIYKAGVQVTQQGGAYTRVWSPSKFVAMLIAAFPDNREEFGWSATIAALAASLVVATAIPLAWFSRTNRAVAVVAFTLAVVALAIPGPIVGLALIRIFNAPHAPPLNYLYDHTIAAPAIAQTIRAFPLGLFIIWHAFRSVPQPLVDAAELDGAGPLRRLALALRLRITAIALAWAAAFVVALGELAATILVVPPGVTTLAVHIFGLLHYNVEDQVAAISLALIALHAAAALVLFSILRCMLHLRSTAACN